MLQQLNCIRSGRRWYGGPYTALIPGGPPQVYPCVREYFPFVAFGDDRLVPSGALYTTIPSHVVKQIIRSQDGKEQIPYMCLGVFGRGKKDEFERDEERGEYVPRQGSDLTLTSKEEKTSLPPLFDYMGKPIVTTQCNNDGAVIEWVVVPFIDEEGAKIINPNNNDDDGDSTSAQEL